MLFIWFGYDVGLFYAWVEIWVLIDVCVVSCFDLVVLVIWISWFRVWFVCSYRNFAC